MLYTAAMFAFTVLIRYARVDKGPQLFYSWLNFGIITKCLLGF